MSNRYSEANHATGDFTGRNAVYAESESGDSDEEHNNNRPYYDNEKNIRPLEASDTTASMKSISHTDHSHHKFYKPFSNRTPVLSVFLLAIGACILLMELAIKTHPTVGEVHSVLRRSVESEVIGEPFALMLHPLSLEVLSDLGQRDMNGAGHMKRSSVVATAISTTPKAVAPSSEPTTVKITSTTVATKAQDVSRSTSEKQAQTSNASSTKEIVETRTLTSSKQGDLSSLAFTELGKQSTAQMTSDVSNAHIATSNIETSSSKTQVTASFPIVSAPAPIKQIITNVPTTVISSSKLEDTPAAPVNFIDSSKSPKREETPSPEPAVTTSGDLHSIAISNAPIITPEPVTNGIPTIPSIISSGKAIAEDNRPSISAPVTTSTTPVLISTSSGGVTGAPNPVNLLITTSSAATPGQPPPDNQLVTSSPPTVTPQPNPDNLLVTTEVTVGQPPPDNQLVTSSQGASGQPNPNNLLVTTSQPPPGQPNPNLNLVTTSQNNGNQDANNGNQNTNGSPTTSRPVTVGSPAPNSQLVTGNPNSKTDAAAVSVTSKVIATVTGSNGIISTITSSTVVAIATTAPPASIVSGSIIVSGSSVIGTINVTAQVQALGSGSVSSGRAGIVVLTDSRGQPTATVSFTGSIVLTNSNGEATATISYTTPQGAVPTGTKGTSDSSIVAPEKEVAWNQFSYFFAKYFPNIIAVILQATWLIIFATFKMMEPFYQLASPRGASAGRGFKFWFSLHIPRLF